MRLSRKKFLAILLGLTGVSFLGGHWLSSSRFRGGLRELSDPVEVSDLASTMSGLEEYVQLIGERASDLYFERSEPEDLVRDINEALSEGDLNEQVFEELSERLRRLIVADFEQGRVVSIENWLFTETEAKVCAALSG